MINMIKKHSKLLVCLVCLTLAAAWFATRPSTKRTAAFALRHQDLLSEFISLTYAENQDHGLRSIYDSGNSLEGREQDLFQWDPVSVSPELCAAWQRIRSYGYFNSVSCSFEEKGGLEVTFSAKGKWKPYEEGNYRIAYCLVWQDGEYANNSRWPLEDWWPPLDGMDISSLPQDGKWYYTSHKHYDG